MITANLSPPGKGRTVSYLTRIQRSAPAQFEFGFRTAEADARAWLDAGSANGADRIDVVFTGAVEASAGAERALVRAGQIAHLPAGWSEARYREQTREAYALFGPDIRLAAEWGPSDPPPAPERMRLWPKGVANGSLSGPLCRIEHSAAASLDVLTARLLAGDQIPLQGTSQLPCWDIEIILSGRVEARVDGEYIVLGGGDVALIPPNAHQWVRFLEDTELLVIFFGHQAPTIDLAELGGIQEAPSA